MSGHRHAASALYGVSAPDQEAVLNALPAADQRILRAHLIELRDLGFDPAAMRTATAAMATGPAAAAPPATPLARVRLADVGAVRAVLAQEPDGLVADVLALDAWPWSAALLAGLPAARKVALRLLGERAAPGAELRVLLLAELDRLVAAAVAARPPAPLHDAAPAAPAPPVVRRTLAERWMAWTR